MLQRIQSLPRKDANDDACYMKRCTTYCNIDHERNALVGFFLRLGVDFMGKSIPPATLYGLRGLRELPDPNP